MQVSIPCIHQQCPLALLHWIPEWFCTLTRKTYASLSITHYEPVTRKPVMMKMTQNTPRVPWLSLKDRSQTV